MRRPSQYPNVPHAVYANLLAPAVDDVFLNRAQEGFTDLIGGTFGRSATIIGDEFATRAYFSTNREGFAQQVVVNSTFGWRVPTEKAHGVMEVVALAAGAMQDLMVDADHWIGTLNFTMSERVCIDVHHRCHIGHILCSSLCRLAFGYFIDEVFIV